MVLLPKLRSAQMTDHRWRWATLRERLAQGLKHSDRVSQQRLEHVLWSWTGCLVPPISSTSKHVGNNWLRSKTRGHRSQKMMGVWRARH